MTTPLLEIEDLSARVCDKEIIKGFNLTINEGEVHAVMGRTGPENQPCPMSSAANPAMK